MRIVTRFVLLFLFVGFYSAAATAQVSLSGTITATSGGAPIEGVYLDLLDSSGEYVTSDTTDASGTYLFDMIAEGDYIVHIPASEFTSGGPLHSFASSASPPALRMRTSIPLGVQENPS